MLVSNMIFVILWRGRGVNTPAPATPASVLASVGTVVQFG